MKQELKAAIDQLAYDFIHTLNFTFHTVKKDGRSYRTSFWPGDEQEDVMICVYQGHEICEPFHRQDFFFFNYAYKNEYATQSDENGTLVSVQEGECYIGQPYNGYALRAVKPDDVTIFGVLIKRDVFLRDYLQTLAADADMFRFFLEPQKDKFAEGFIHLSLRKVSAIRTLLEMMVVEYANKKEDTQAILKPMILTMFMMLARQYRKEKRALKPAPASLSAEILQYMYDRTDVTSLTTIAKHFSYHPNYVSSLIHKETGRTFSQILLEMRMERAKILLKNTQLSVEEIAYMLGYSNQSNFYKAFRSVYGRSPREFIRKTDGTSNNAPNVTPNDALNVTGH